MLHYIKSATFSNIPHPSGESLLYLTQVPRSIKNDLVKVIKENWAKVRFIISLRKISLTNSKFST